MRVQTLETRIEFIQNIKNHCLKIKRTKIIINPQKFQFKNMSKTQKKSSFKTENFKTHSE